MSNRVVHTELNTTDVEKAKTFFGQLFDWKLEEMPGSGGAYTLIKVGDSVIGGIMQHPLPGASSTWLSYIDVDDIHAATDKAQSLGATILKGASEVPGTGWFSILLDPTGAPLGLWQSKR
jgi:predicted enzyme related to lactoylglutathione lyase